MPRRVFDCFNKSGEKRGHFYGCRALHKSGVWVGYLAPEKRNQGFEGLASFDQLKENHRRNNPRLINGTAGIERTAVCRGCASENFQLFTLKEINFGDGTKVVIMRLDGEDDMGMFCILEKLPTDRSLPLLQCWQPYKYRREKNSNFMLLSLRDGGQTSGTLESVRIALGHPHPPPPPEPQTPSESTSPEYQQRSASSSPNDQEKTQSVKQPGSSAAQKRRLSESSLQNESSGKRQDTETPVPPAFELATDPQETTPSLADSDRNTAVPPLVPPSRLSTSRTKNARVPAGVEIIALEPTEEQSERVRLEWFPQVGGIGRGYGYSLRECKTLSSFFNLVRKQVADDPEVLAVVEDTKVWQLTYKLPDQPQEATYLLPNDETGFDKIVQSLAESSVWDTDPKRVEIELRVVR
ncbi:hypothetical protein K458DRAFT_435864 [Lentithecium fluviatile CBS 122367]|uniref:Uncharacterized protein n=1 Tax=Lentithecium fluviatile CBS 122367 TaxID=1168545 RepID=A0A6G1IK02_9PLEO|nr:hypothetical protein K458DRAFT_435864 [Lentithecium fluviatile CBS 122367]